MTTRVPAPRQTGPLAPRQTGPLAPRQTGPLAPRQTGFLTPQEVAAELRVSPAVVLRLVRRGDLPALRVGRVWRVDGEDLRRWIRQHRHARASAGRAGNAALNGRGGPCLCGCGEHAAPDARFRPGHSGKMVHRLMNEDGMTFDAAREAVRRVRRPRQQQRLF